jgi:hypothetical protein
VSLDPNKIGIAVYCGTCGQRKAPIGRSVPFAMSMCERECPGYEQEPKPGSLWPQESEEDFGYPVFSNDGTTLSAHAVYESQKECGGVNGRENQSKG